MADSYAGQDEVKQHAITSVCIPYICIFILNIWDVGNYNWKRKRKKDRQKERKKERKKEGRKEGSKEGRKEVRKEGRKGGKSNKAQGFQLSENTKHLNSRVPCTLHGW